MKLPPPLHAWDLAPKAAVALQRELAGQTVVLPDRGPGSRLRPPAGTEWQGNLPVLVAGVDASYTRFDKRCYAAVVVWHRLEDRVVETVTATGATPFPYVPGLLSFREGPIVLEALGKLKSRPGVFMFDGQGIAHPRRFGLATHLGLWLKVPTVGCAKSRLCGAHDEPARAKGSSTRLMGSTGGARPVRIGTVLRTKDACNPLFVSPGHHASHAFAVKLVLACCTRYRMPEPTRLADHETKRLRKADP